MAFKGLEDRFAAKANQLYGKYSTKDGSSDQPYLEYKPNNPDRNETANDSRMVPIGSVRRDLMRMGKFLVSGKGLLFLANQEILQLGNTFSESRIINPLFVIANTVPFVHSSHALANPSSFAVKGDTSQASPASDATIGGAGRLQVETARSVVNNLFAVGGKNSIFSLLPSSNIIQTVTNVFSLIDKGSLGVNQRPELSFNGEYFSIALWKGFRRVNGFRNNLDSAAANLRIGNFKAAYQNIKNVGNDVINQVSNIFHGVSGLLPNHILPTDGRDRLTSGIEGKRYFITNDVDADRYIKNSVMFTTTADGYEFSSVQLSFLNREPYTLNNTTPTTVNVGRARSTRTRNRSTIQRADNIIGGAAKSADSLRRSVQISNVVNSFNNHTVVANTVNSLASGSGLPGSSDNPGETAMLFPGLSLKNRYTTDERLTFIRNQLTIQLQTQAAYWQRHRSSMGWKENNTYKPGAPVVIDPSVKTRVRNTLSDNINKVTIIDTPGDEISSTQHNEIVKNIGRDLINVWFFDYVNKKTIPFRAFISGLNESVHPEYNDTRYIGRIERNIVYMGVTRDVSFQLKIHAMSEPELLNIWKKMEYLTGLCYPSKFNSGFMVPPLVKLTLGSIYDNQPCYIKSLTHTAEDGTPWETKSRAQVPHGIISAITVSIIEKDQKKTGSNFYAVTTQS